MKKFLGIILLIGLLIIVIGAVSSSGNSDNPSSPEAVQCGISAQNAFEISKQKNSGENFPEIDGTKDNKKDESASFDYKYNYKTDLGLCFIEYIVSMQATTVDTNEPIKGEGKIVSALVADISKQQRLAGFAKTSYPTGSQKILGCSVQLPGNYDDINNKPIKDLLNPTQCNSESEFDSIVADRFGIK